MDWIGLTVGYWCFHRFRECSQAHTYPYKASAHGYSLEQVPSKVTFFGLIFSVLGNGIGLDFTIPNSLSLQYDFSNRGRAHIT